jgi:hypothetical protein
MGEADGSLLLSATAHQSPLALRLQKSDNGGGPEEGSRARGRREAARGGTGRERITAARGWGKLPPSVYI